MTSMRFVIRLVEALHEQVTVGIDGQHRERQERQVVRPLFPVLPYPGNAEWSSFDIDNFESLDLALLV
jgi:hypothetical protein